jgi:putative hemolysin
MEQKANNIEARPSQPVIGGSRIEIDSVIKHKSPRLHQFLPRFVINYLKRTIHQDELNTFIREHSHLFGLDFADAIITDFGITVHFSGLEHIPSSGMCIIAANHPLGGMDGIALITVAGKIRKDIIFPVNDLLMHLDNLRELFIPINKHGSNAENVRIIHSAFASNNVILYFPAGLVSRKQKGGIIEDLEWKKTFITKARQYKLDIIPAHIDGRNRDFFYNLARFRKRIGIKQNIEMLYLVDEMYKQFGKSIHITFGKAIPWETFDKRRTDPEWAVQVKHHVYQLGKVPESTFSYLS